MLEGVQRGECNGLLKGQISIIPDSSSARHKVMFVLHSVAGKRLQVAIVLSERYLEPEGMVSRHDV